MKAPRQLSENTPTMLHSVDKNEELVILSRNNGKCKVRYRKENFELYVNEEYYYHYYFIVLKSECFHLSKLVPRHFG
ncbi:unnamed protein product [Hymenolepis diminuta]|uniref:Uncharacterized protein n=1 Tax=Hymenolepis diminuta TaxID=6216 RepID=A0A564YLL8_HYMDI|nr:unnamed protein product [Hymenolepis diminuta]